MATNIARAKTAAEAIADKALTNQLLIDIADAFAFTYARDKANLTNEQKATVYINALRSFTKQVVSDYKISTAMEVTRATTALTATPDLGADGVLP